MAAPILGGRLAAETGRLLARIRGGRAGQTIPVPRGM